MSVALDVNQAVAGFVNTHDDKLVFTLQDVNDYIVSLWNAGCGPVRLNFTQNELANYLDSCMGICLDKYSPRYKINKSLLDDCLNETELSILNHDEEKIKSFILFCKLKVSINTNDYLLDAMGFRFMYE